MVLLTLHFTTVNCQPPWARFRAPHSPRAATPRSSWVPKGYLAEGHGPRKATVVGREFLKRLDSLKTRSMCWTCAKCYNVHIMLHMCIEAERITQSTVLFREHGESMWMSVLWMSGDVKTSQAKEAKLQSWVFHYFRLNIEETQEKESKERKTMVSN